MLRLYPTVWYTSTPRVSKVISPLNGQTYRVMIGQDRSIGVWSGSSRPQQAEKQKIQAKKFLFSLSAMYPVLRILPYLHPTYAPAPLPYWRSYWDEHSDSVYSSIQIDKHISLVLTCIYAPDKATVWHGFFLYFFSFFCILFHYIPLYAPSTHHRSMFRDCIKNTEGENLNIKISKIWISWLCHCWYDRTRIRQ